MLSLLNHTVIHAPEESFFAQVLHGGSTATGNFNVTAALATITLLRHHRRRRTAHGFVQHWKNMVPHGLPLPVTILLIPIEIMGMFVRPFALTMRLAANMTGGHIAILAILSFVFIFAEMYGAGRRHRRRAVFCRCRSRSASRRSRSSSCWCRHTCSRCLTAVFIGMAIHAHH